VARAPQAVGHAHVALALLDIEALERDHHGLTALQTLGDGRVEQLTRAGLDLVIGNAAGEQRPDLGQRERDPALLQDALQKQIRRRRGGADDQQQAAGGVAHPV
jgi:hypothetical protein